jgi:hypothetical protein
MKKAYVLVSGRDITYDTLDRAEAEARAIIKDEDIFPLFIAEVKVALWAEKKLKIIREELGR